VPLRQICLVWHVVVVYKQLCQGGLTRFAASRSSRLPTSSCWSSPPSGTSGRTSLAARRCGIARMDAVTFSHIKHLQADAGRKVSNPTCFSCTDCHPIPFDRFSKGSFRMEAPHDSGGCVQCHSGRKRNNGKPLAFAANTRCLTCHKPSSVSPNDTYP